MEAEAGGATTTAPFLPRVRLFTDSTFSIAVDDAPSTSFAWYMQVDTFQGDMPIEVISLVVSPSGVDGYDVDILRTGCVSDDPQARIFEPLGESSLSQYRLAVTPFSVVGFEELTFTFAVRECSDAHGIVCRSCPAQASSSSVRSAVATFKLNVLGLDLEPLPATWDAPSPTEQSVVEEVLAEGTVELQGSGLLSVPPEILAVAAADSIAAAAGLVGPRVMILRIHLGTSDQARRLQPTAGPNINSSAVTGPRLFLDFEVRGRADEDASELSFVLQNLANEVNDPENGFERLLRESLVQQGLDPDSLGALEVQVHVRYIFGSDARRPSDQEGLPGWAVGVIISLLSVTSCIVLVCATAMCHRRGTRRPYSLRLRNPGEKPRKEPKPETLRACASAADGSHIATAEDVALELAGDGTGIILDSNGREAPSQSALALSV